MDLLDFFRDQLSAQAILDYIDWLPRNSAYHAAMADDDDLAEAILAVEEAEDDEDSQPPAKPRLTDFGTLEEKLTEISDRVATLTSVVANWGSGKTIKPPRPSPRPETALQRARLRRARQDLDALESMLFPAESGGPPTE